MNPNRPPESTPSVSRGKLVMFSLVATLGFFVLVEGALLIAGVRPSFEQEDPYVGFSSYAPLFAERTAPDGSAKLVTARNKLAWFNRQRFSATKAPNTFRIFSVGGSTTYGRPYDDATSFSGWLRALLPAADPERRWEVVNAGGISYASYRVTKVVEELARYEPDLFIIYTGHNEFLERRTYGSLIETPSLLRGLTTALSRTRTYTVFQRFLRRGPRTPLDHRESAELLPAEVDALLDRSVGPSAYTRDDPFRDRVLEHFRFSLERMLDLAAAAGARVILVEPASNLRDCSPFKSEHRQGLDAATIAQCDAHLDRARERLEADDAEAVLSETDRGLALDDRFAELHFLRGEALSRLGRFEEARNAWIRARDEDVCPLRALRATAEVVRGVAHRRDVPCIDFPAIAAAHSPGGIAGEEMFLDHLHPTIEGNRRLAIALVGELIRMDLVRPTSGWGEDSVRAVAQRIESDLDPRQHAEALRNLAKVFGWAGKYEEADDLALRVVELLPDDAEAQGMAAFVHHRRGDPGLALRGYEAAIRIDPDYLKGQYLYASCLRELGRSEEAVTPLEHAIRLDPAFAEAHAELAAVHLDLGHDDDARVSAERALAIRPDLPGARATLDRLRNRGGS